MGHVQVVEHVYGTDLDVEWIVQNEVAHRDEEQLLDEQFLVDLIGASAVNHCKVQLFPFFLENCGRVGVSLCCFVSCLCMC